MDNKQELLITAYGAMNRDLLHRLRDVEKETKELRDDIETLKKIVSKLMGEKTIVYRMEDIVRYPVPQFILDENIGGETIIRVYRK